MPTQAQLDDIQAQLDAFRKETPEAAVNATPGNLPDNLPRNRDGLPEYATVTFTLDHLFDKGDGEVRNKMLYSTETMPEAISALLSYYGFAAGNAATFARILEIVGEAAKAEYEGGILVLTAPRNPHDKEDRGPVVEVLMATQSYYDLIEHPDFGKGSSLVAASEMVQAVFSTLTNRADPATGAWPVLSYLKLIEADYADAFPEPASEDVKLYPGDTAEGTSNEVTGGQHFGSVGDNNLG